MRKKRVKVFVFEMLLCLLFTISFSEAETTTKSFYVKSQNIQNQTYFNGTYKCLVENRLFSKKDQFVFSLNIHATNVPKKDTLQEYAEKVTVTIIWGKSGRETDRKNFIYKKDGIYIGEATDKFDAKNDCAKAIITYKSGTEQPNTLTYNWP